MKSSRVLTTLDEAAADDLRTLDRGGKGAQTAGARQRVLGAGWQWAPLG